MDILLFRFYLNISDSNVGFGDVCLDISQSGIKSLGLALVSAESSIKSVNLILNRKQLCADVGLVSLALNQSFICDNVLLFEHCHSSIKLASVGLLNIHFTFESSRANLKLSQSSGKAVMLGLSICAGLFNRINL